MSSPNPQRPVDTHPAPRAPSQDGLLRANDTPGDIPDASDGDRALRQALRHSLSAGAASSDEQARLAELHTRWMQDWAQGAGVSPPVPDAVADRLPAAAGRHRNAVRGRLATAGGSGGLGRAPRWFGGLGVALALGAAALLWQQHQNELLLDELSQVDVLSQMTAGEM